jgi:hypothetical protein
MVLGVRRLVRVEQMCPISHFYPQEPQPNPHDRLARSANGCGAAWNASGRAGEAAAGADRDGFGVSHRRAYAKFSLGN